MINLFPDGSCVGAYRDAPGKRIKAEMLRFDPGTAALRLTRRGADTRVAALDNHGVELGSKSIQVPALASGGKAGFFVLSHDAMQLSEAKFSHVEFTPATTTNPTKTP